MHLNNGFQSQGSFLLTKGAGSETLLEGLVFEQKQTITVCSSFPTAKPNLKKVLVKCDMCAQTHTYPFEKLIHIPLQLLCLSELKMSLYAAQREF